CFVYAMKYQAEQGLGNVEEAIQNFTEYLNRLDLVTDIETNNLLAFGDYLIQHKLNVEQYYMDHINDKQFTEQLHKSLVFSYLHRYLPNQFEKTESEIEKCKSEYPQLRSELRDVILVVLF